MGKSMLNFKEKNATEIDFGLFFSCNITIQICSLDPNAGV